MQRFHLQGFIKDVIKFMNKDAMHLHAAAISFFAIFAFIPLLITTYLIYQRYASGVATEFLLATSEAFGTQTTNTLLTIARDLETVEVSTFSFIVGGCILLYSMTRLMYFLQKSMNKIWMIRSKQGFLRVEVQHRILSLISVLALMALITVIVLQKTTILYLTRAVGSIAAEIIFFAVSALAMYSLFAFLYKFIPDRTIHWSDVSFGAIFTTVFFWLGYLLFGRILSIGFVGNIYATISYALLALLLVNYFAQIFYIGAEITKVYALTYGSLKKRRREFQE